MKTRFTFTCLKLAIETQEKGVKYSVSVVEFEQVNVSWEVIRN